MFRNGRLETTFLIPNLHCPTCASYIQTLLEEFESRPIVRSLSIIEHTLTIQHEASLLSVTIADSLANAGYEVFDVILDPTSSERRPSTNQRSDLLQDAVHRWNPKRPAVDDIAKEKHSLHCQLCAAHNTAVKISNSESAVIVDHFQDSLELVATIAIDGMTCSSCVRAVDQELSTISSVTLAEVSLVNHSATIHFNAENVEGELRRLKECIEDIGYGAEVIDWRREERKSSRTLNQSDRELERTVSLSIQGMHCPRCPQRILETLNSFSVLVHDAPSMNSPQIKLSYTPDAPHWTVRTIISTIEDLDPAFMVEVAKSPSLEERSRRMLARERKEILARAVLALVAAIPTLIIGIVYMDLVGSRNPGYVYLMRRLHGVSRAEWANFIMATPVYIFAADHFHRRTYKELRALWRPGSTVPVLKRFYRFGSMNMLISLGTTIAYFSSLVLLIVTASDSSGRRPQNTQQGYFDSVVFLTLFLLLGRLAEAHMKARSGDAVAALSSLRPTEAMLVSGKEEDSIVPINLDLVDIGDVLRIFRGACLPCDGVLLDEVSDFNESSLTGESRPVKKSRGDPVYAGTINNGSALSIRVTGPAGASMLDSIITVVREGLAKRAPMERVADILTAYFVPVIVLTAIATWLIWLSLGLSGALPDSYLDYDVGGWSFWSLQFAIAVFVIACPCGLGLAAPTALFVGGGMAAKRGILVKGGGEAFQEASDLDCVVFDKTGTLTQGIEPRIVKHTILDDDLSLDEQAIFGLILRVEQNSSHPLAKACVTFAYTRSSVSVKILSADEIAGKGIKAVVDHPKETTSERLEMLIGNEHLLNDYGVPLPQSAAQELESWKTAGYSVVLLACRSVESEAKGWRLLATLAAADPLRSEASDVVAGLQALNIDVWMLSGDNPKTAIAVGKRVGIPSSNVIAGVLPTQKAEKIQYLQKSLRKNRRRSLLSRLVNKRSRATIAMVGDGINDAPALSASDVGIAVASGSDVAVQSAAFVLVHSDLSAVLTLVRLSKAVFKRMVLNFMWAAIYNIIALPIAAGVLYPINTAGGGHVRLDPVYAALAMALSSVSVVSSSLLLRSSIPGIGFRD